MSDAEASNTSPWCFSPTVRHTRLTEDDQPSKPKNQRSESQHDLVGVRSGLVETYLLKERRRTAQRSHRFVGSAELFESLTVLSQGRRQVGASPDLVEDGLCRFEVGDGGVQVRFREGQADRRSLAEDLTLGERALCLASRIERIVEGGE